MTGPEAIRLAPLLPSPVRIQEGTIQLPVQGLAVVRVCDVNVNVNVNNLLAISIQDFDNSGEPGPQAKGVNHLETPLRQLHVTHRASSCAKRGGHVQLCSKPRGARGIEPETFRRRGQLLRCVGEGGTGLLLFRLFVCMRVCVYVL